MAVTHNLHYQWRWTERMIKAGDIPQDMATAIFNCTKNNSCWYTHVYCYVSLGCLSETIQLMCRKKRLASPSLPDEKIARSRADDGVFKQSLVLHGCTICSTISTMQAI